MSENRTLIEKVKDTVKLSWYKSCSFVMLFLILMVAARAVTAVQDVIIDQIVESNRPAMKEFVIGRLGK